MDCQTSLISRDPDGSEIVTFFSDSAYTAAAAKMTFLSRSHFVNAVRFNTLATKAQLF